MPPKVPQKRLTKPDGSILMLFLALALVLVQIMGLHFHVHQASGWNTSAVAPVVHAAHSDVHDACHKDGCGVDVSVTEFWKSPGQGWSVFALFAVACILLLSISSRGVPRPTFTDELPHSRPIFLRPPLRAPPL